jgi:hypothetical protein
MPSDRMGKRIDRSLYLHQHRQASGVAQCMICGGLTHRVVRRLVRGVGVLGCVGANLACCGPERNMGCDVAGLALFHLHSPFHFLVPGYTL